MIKQLMIVSLLTFGAHAAYAQQSTVPSRAGPAAGSTYIAAGIAAPD
jgi:hypothetical protein